MLKDAFIHAATRMLNRLAQNRYGTDLLFLLLATLAAGFWHYNYYWSFSSILQVLVTVLFILVWVIGAFAQGYTHHISFLLISAAFWMVPQIFIILFANLPVLDYNVTLDMLASVSRLLVQAPFGTLIVETGIHSLFLAMFLVFLCDVSFVAGLYVRKKSRFIE